MTDTALQPIEEIRDILKKIIVDEKYELQIQFSENQNPYIGLYIRNIPAKQLTNFNCEVIDTFGKDKAYIQISEQSLQVDSEKLATLLKATNRYITSPTGTG